MKKKILKGFAFIIILLLGMFIQKIITKVTDRNSFFDTVIQEMIKESNEKFASDVKIKMSLLEDYNIDTNISEYIIIKKTNSIIDYFEYILSSDKKLATFSIERIKSILNDDIYLDDFYQNAELINPLYNTIEENRMYISLCFSMIVGRCMEAYQESALIVGIFDGVSMISPKDTVKLGDFFETKIYFSVRDLTLDYNIMFEDNTIFRGNIYKEKAKKKGQNTKKGELVYINGRKELFFPFEISYYVK
jgi:hypothetical protein